MSQPDYSSLTPQSPMPFNLALLISRAMPGAKFHLIGGNIYDGLQWSDERPKPTFEQVLEWAAEYPLPGPGEDILSDLRPYVAKAMRTTAYNAFSLMQILFSTRMTSALLGDSIRMVRAGMPQDFTAEEVAEINRILLKYGINVVLE